MLRGELGALKAQCAAGTPTVDLAARLEDLHGFASAVEAGLREMAGSIEGKSLARRSLFEVLSNAVRLAALRGDVEPELEIVGDVDNLAESERIAVARFVQEALSNAQKHSQATWVLVRVRVYADTVVAAVVDDGIGFPVESTVMEAGRRGRLGLVGMHERARLLDGTCALVSEPGAGTSASITLPRRTAAAATLRRSA